VGSGVDQHAGRQVKRILLYIDAAKDEARERILLCVNRHRHRERELRHWICAVEIMQAAAGL